MVINFCRLFTLYQNTDELIKYLNKYLKKYIYMQNKCSAKYSKLPNYKYLTRYL